MQTLNLKPATHTEELADQEALLVRESIRLLSKKTDPAYAIREMLHLLSELLGLNRGRVVLPDPERGGLVIRHAYGLTTEELHRGRYAWGEGITGRVMQTGEMLIVQDIDEESSYLARAVKREILPQGTVSFIALPIMVDQRIAGVLGVHRIRSRPRQLGKDIQILRTIAELIAQVFTIERLIEERTQPLKVENLTLKAALKHRGKAKSSWGIVGESPQLLASLEQLEQVSGSDATVLLLGESGTGKELFAHALHLQSPRRDKPFVKVNCAAIPETLFESELFGHEKGAFTGAINARIGRFEQADGGTLFLDEIGDLPLNVQTKLLRVLQEHVIDRIGGRKEIPIDVRIVAATHQDLMTLVRAGRFRLDLFYRLNVIPVRLPALRERQDDIKLLVRHFLFQLNQRHQKNVVITPAGLSSLVSYPWPGNIRQLFNVLERIVLLAREEQIDEPDVDYALVTEAQDQPLDALSPLAMREAMPLTPSAMMPPPRPAAKSVYAAATPSPVSGFAESVQARSIRGYQPVSANERQQIEQALLAHRGNKSQAARMLNLTLRQLNYRIKVLGISS